MAVTLASGGWSVPRQPRLAILGYGSGQQFVDGIDPAVMIGAALVAVGAVAAFAIKRSPQPEHLAVASEVGYVTACACASHEVIVGQAGRAIGQSSSRRGMAAHGREFFVLPRADVGRLRAQ